MTEREMPLVSVVMPVYNAARFLRQAVDSVLSQSYSNLELIMVDDCSKDESLQIMREYEKKDGRVRTIAGETNRGVAHVRNRGIQAAKGKYIALLDSDDVWERTKLEKQIKLLSEENAQIAYCSLAFIDEDGKSIKRPFIVSRTTNYKKILTRCVFTCSTILVDADLLKSHPFPVEYYHEDFLLWTELLSCPIKAVGLPEILAYYRQINGSRSNNKMNSARHRWKIYREALGMNIFRACAMFIQYAFWGVMKYYM